MSSEKENKDFILAYTEDFWNKHDIDAFDKYYAADFVEHAADEELNRERYKGVCQAYFAAFPDLHIDTDMMIAEGDKVVKVWTARCTHKGELMGIPATGKRIVVKGIEAIRIEDGRIAEIWMSMDELGMMQQLGAVSQPGSA
jgi:steroid delta-isomerase-like uncharacterized protein